VERGKEVEALQRLPAEVLSPSHRLVASGGIIIAGTIIRGTDAGGLGAAYQAMRFVHPAVGGRYNPQPQWMR
jgi:hypothetical protein